MIKKLRKFLKIVGPGVITGASDDDPSGIATYSQAGAQGGFSMLWTAPLTFPLMAGVQEMCARVGLVTGHGLSGVLKKHYPSWVVYLLAALVLFANTINIAADIAGMAAAANLLIPIPNFILAVFFSGVIICLLIYAPYHLIANYLKWFTLALFAYFIVPFAIRTDWLDVIYHTTLPNIKFDSLTITLFVAILGTTISPYLFFWQASMEVENKLDEIKAKVLKRWVVTKHEVRLMEEDVTLGMFFSNITMWFIIIATAVTLAPSGIVNIETAEQAAAALKPIAGDFASLLFTLGIVGTGFLAIPVLAGSSSYVLSEAFGWEEGLNKPFHKAKKFYLVIIFSTIVGALINFIGLNPIKMLLYTAVIYGIVSPPLILVILHIANNKKIMGDWTNGRISNYLGISTLFLMSFAAVAFFVVNL
ncbi:MAG: divalent metal cation transporter [Candidatus Woykebacteria bacterium]